MLWECDEVTLLVRLSFLSMVTPVQLSHLKTWLLSYVVLRKITYVKFIIILCVSVLHDVHVGVCAMVWRPQGSCVKSVLSGLMCVLEMELRSWGLGSKSLHLLSYGVPERWCMASFSGLVLFFFQFVLNSFMTTY